MLATGRTLRGYPDAVRCRYDWWAGKIAGQVCSRCGRSRPPLTHDETPCPGAAKGALAVRSARERALPSCLLALAWARLRADDKVDVDPAFVRATLASFWASLCGLGRVLADAQAQRVAEHGRSVFMAGRTPDAHHAHVAVCTLILDLARDGRLDPGSQPALQAAAIVHEVNAFGPACRDRGMMRAAVNAMRSSAESLGYYGDSPIA